MAGARLQEREGENRPMSWPTSAVGSGPAQRLFSADAARRIAGISYRQLDYCSSALYTFELRCNDGEAEIRDWGCFERGVQGTLLPFADWLINSHAYAIRVSTDVAPPVFRIYARNTAPVPCADNLAEFVSLYESGDSRLY
jgi:hypothetical protein